VLLLRGLAAHCPACGHRGAFRRVLWMRDRCPTCTFRFERVEGHWIGSVGTLTTIVCGLMFVVIMAWSLISYPEPPEWGLLWVEVAIAVVGSLLLWPTSRMLWTAIDLLMRPLRPGEIDPRWVVYDPYRDRPGRSSP
jgi:uncharacterized protein (DUF983 family)